MLRPATGIPVKTVTFKVSRKTSIELSLNFVYGVFLSTRENVYCFETDQMRDETAKPQH